MCLYGTGLRAFQLHVQRSIGGALQRSSIAHTTLQQIHDDIAASSVLGCHEVNTRSVDSKIVQQSFLVLVGCGFMASLATGEVYISRYQVCKEGSTALYPSPQTRRTYNNDGTKSSTILQRLRLRALRRSAVDSSDSLVLA